jgi:hypothetical protein
MGSKISGGGGAASDATLTTSDITTNNVSTTKHGFAPKAPNDATRYLDGTGAYSVPAGGISQATADGRYVKQDGSTAGATTQRQVLQNSAEFGVNGSITGSLLFRDGTAASVKFATIQFTGFPTGNRQLLFDNSAFTANRTWVWPNVSDTFVGVAAVQTLTSKTLTTPKENGVTVATRNVTGTDTATATDYALTCDATAAGFVENLPAATGSGQMFRIKKIDSTANAVTITPNGADTIDGAATKVLNTQWSSVDLIDTAAGKWSLY